jgi:hypothetical protein
MKKKKLVAIRKRPVSITIRSYDICMKRVKHLLTSMKIAPGIFISKTAAAETPMWRPFSRVLLF